MLQTWVSVFLHDSKIHIALLLVLADFVFGVGAAFKLKNFRFSYIADFLRNDILQKLLPYFAVYVFALVAGHITVGIPGLDFGIVAGAVYATLIVAWTGSILSSLGTLFPGVALKASSGRTTVTNALFGNENSAPPKD